MTPGKQYFLDLHHKLSLLEDFIGYGCKWKSDDVEAIRKVMKIVEKRTPKS